MRSTSFTRDRQPPTYCLLALKVVPLPPSFPHAVPDAVEGSHANSQGCLEEDYIMPPLSFLHDGFVHVVPWAVTGRTGPIMTRTEVRSFNQP